MHASADLTKGRNAVPNRYRRPKATQTAPADPRSLALPTSFTESCMKRGKIAEDGWVFAQRKSDRSQLHMAFVHFVRNCKRDEFLVSASMLDYVSRSLRCASPWASPQKSTISMSAPASIRSARLQRPRSQFRTVDVVCSGVRTLSMFLRQPRSEAAPRANDLPAERGRVTGHGNLDGLSKRIPS